MEHVGRCGFGKAHKAAFEALKDIVQVLVVNLMRYEYEFHVLMLFYIARQQLLVVRPCTTGDNYFRRRGLELIETCVDEMIYGWNILGVLRNPSYAVKAGIACYFHVDDVELLQQLQRCGVLNVEFGESCQQMAVTGAPRLKERLLWTEDTGDEVSGDIPMIEFAQVSRPELVLNKDCHRRLKHMQEMLGVAFCSEG